MHRPPIVSRRKATVGSALQRLEACYISPSAMVSATLKSSGHHSRVQSRISHMKAWFEKLAAQLNALFAPRMQPIPVRSEEQRRLAAERQRRR